MRALWAFLLFRWMTFSAFDWNPLPAELALATLPPIGGLHDLRRYAGR